MSVINFVDACYTFNTLYYYDQRIVSIKYIPLERGTEINLEDGIRVTLYDDTLLSNPEIIVERRDDENIRI